MSAQFMISKNPFHFIVTVSPEKVTVEPEMPCRYKKDFCNVFAKSHESILSEYLRREKVESDLYSWMLHYHAQKQWVITKLGNPSVQQ